MRLRALRFRRAIFFDTGVRRLKISVGAIGAGVQHPDARTLGFSGFRAPQFPEYRFRAPVGDTHLGFANSDATRYLVKLPPGSIRTDGAAKRHFDRRQTYESRRKTASAVAVNQG